MELSTSKKLLLGSGLRVVAFVVTVLIGLWLIPFKIHTLGDELYGIWVLATSFIAMFSLLDIGLNAAVGRYAAATLGKKDYAGLNRYLNTGYYIFCGISFFSLFIAGGVAWYIYQHQAAMPHIGREFRVVAVVDDDELHSNIVAIGVDASEDVAHDFDAHISTEGLISWLAADTAGAASIVIEVHDTEEGWKEFAIVENPDTASNFQLPTYAIAVAIVIIILGLKFAILLPLQAVAGLLHGALRYDIATAIAIVSKIISSIAVFLTLFYGGGLVGIAIASLVCALVSRSVTVWFARREVPQAEIALQHFDKKTIRELFSFSGYAFIISITETIRTKIPIFIVGAYVSVAAVTPFSIAVLLTSYFSQVIGAVLGILMPVFARQQAREDFVAIRKTLKFANKVSTTIAIFVAFGMIAWGGHFIECWMWGKEE